MNTLYKNPTLLLNVTVLLIALCFVSFSDASAGVKRDNASVGIFFLIDNSASMSQTGIGNDAQGSRFRVAYDLVDTIKARFDSAAEVGIAVFQQYLYFRPENDSIFKKCPGWDSGSYIPLLNLQQVYPQSSSRTGYEILKFYLDTVTVQQGINSYVDLKYKPNPLWGGGGPGSTNISIGFDAAKDAFLYSKITDKNRHFIIFLSDGEANQPTNNVELMKKYIKGENTPTTFTVFFTRTGTPPTQLVQMTDNIKANGYSLKNPFSNIWAIQTDYPTLMKLLITNILDSLVTAINSSVKQSESRFRLIQAKHSISVIFSGDMPQSAGARVYDLNGRLVHTICFSGMKRNVLEWNFMTGNNRSMAPGIYIMKITGDNLSHTFTVRAGK